MADGEQSEPPLVSLEQIENAPAPDPKSPSRKATSELNMLAHEQEQFRNELGLLGKPFGGKKEKPGNISGLVIVLCFIVILCVYIFPPGPELGMSFEKIFSGMLSIITLILGYLFGSNDKS